jgi:hypothetical protein
VLSSPATTAIWQHAEKESKEKASQEENCVET